MPEISSPIRVGILSSAHGHVWSYLHGLKAHPDAQLIGVWDHDLSRLQNFAASSGIPPFESIDELLKQVDAVVICSENVHHHTHAMKALEAGCHVICEKPLVVKAEDGEEMIAAARESGLVLMTAFPCRFSPTYQELKRRVHAGEIGEVKAIMATNRGTCPHDWFVVKELSGGGAMIDHTVHVADLLRDLLGEEPVKVSAQIGNNLYGKEWDDTAMVTLDYPSGIFATLDSSWSRPKSYKTWGDVTMKVVGTQGTLELDMFGEELDVYANKNMRHSVAGFGANLDKAMIAEFISAVLQGRAPLVTGEHGLAAAKVAIAAYASL